MTASAREVVLEQGEKNVNFKVCKRDFQDYGGVFKMPDFDTKGVHYMHTMQKFNIPLLGEYADFEDEDLEDRVISHDGKVIVLSCMYVFLCMLCMYNMYVQYIDEFTLRK